MDRLAELETFLAIVEAGSLAGAGRRLRRSAPAVTRTLAELEARVGVTLIERTTRASAPTEAGRQLAAHAQALLAGYRDAIGEVAGEAAEPRGAIRLTAPLVFGRLHVAPLVAAFLERYPEVAIDFTLADRIVDLQDEHVDLAVRIGPVTDPALVVRRVGQVTQVIVASPDYLARHGTPARPQDLARHRVIQHTSLGLQAPWVLRDAVVAVTAQFAVNQADIAIAAARAGQGLVRALSYQVDTDLRRGRLVRVLQDCEPEPMPVGVVWPESRRAVRRVRLLADHLAAALARLPVLRVA